MHFFAAWRVVARQKTLDWCSPELKHVTGPEGPGEENGGK
jgi:hypothetical protein